MEISTLPLGMLETNCYVVSDETTGLCAVIDPADSGSRIADALTRSGLKPQAILLTHGHYDHVGGVKALHEATGAPVYLNKKELALGESMTGGPLFHTDAYGEGDTVTVGNLTFSILETPGHTPGSVCLLCGDALFSGDTLFQGSCGRTDFPLGSWEEMLASLKRLAELEGNLRVFPGHGGESELDTERRYNAYLREAVR